MRPASFTMELSPHVNLKKTNASISSPEKDLLAASISDLSAAFHDEEEEINQKDPLNYLMSSLRSFVDDGEEFPEDLLDDWPCDLDDEIDFNKSVRELLSSVNDLLHSKTTFTLNEGTSLETEMMRLKRFSRRNPQKDNWQPNFNPLSLGDHVMKGVSSPDEVQKQKEKLANVLKDALGEKEEDFFRLPKIKADRHPKSSKPLKPKPLNPNRFVAETKCDSAPVSPTKRSRGTFKSPVGMNSAPLSPEDHSRSPVKRWDSENPSQVKRSDSAPRWPIKRPVNEIKGPRLTSMPCLDEPSDDPCPQAMVPAIWEHDAAPKKPIRMQSGRHLVI
jgi:hypothetical protein